MDTKGEREGQVAAEEKPTTGELGQETSGMTGLILLCGLIAFVWFAFTYAVVWVFPEWQTRGQVGDSFGAVNALFSGLAFAGVIYALHLQRKELTYQRKELEATRSVYEAQVQEMRSARELQAQPLAIPSACEFRIERPKFFYTPPEDTYSAQSRYTATLGLNNPTAHPTLNVNVRCRVALADPNRLLGSVDNFVAIIAPHESIPDESKPDFLFSGDSSAELLDALRQNDPRRVPIIWVMIIFKNIVGAHFYLLNAFRIYVRSAEQLETLRVWHTTIAGFGARYKHELAELKELRRRRNEAGWDALFERIKKETRDLAAGDDHLTPLAVPIPQSFALKQIGAEEFDEILKTASYSQFIGGHYDCPAELESRSSD